MATKKRTLAYDWSRLGDYGDAVRDLFVALGYVVVEPKPKGVVATPGMEVFWKLSRTTCLRTRIVSTESYAAKFGADNMGVMIPFLNDRGRVDGHDAEYFTTLDGQPIIGYEDPDA